MALKTKCKVAARLRRKMHIRKRVHGTAQRPRLVVARSLKHIYASLVDDIRGVTLTGVSDFALNNSDCPIPEKPLEFEESGRKLPLTPKVAKAYQVGLAIAAIAKNRGITKVVFDRNGLRYHGRVRALAVGARKGGLEL